MQGLSFIEVLDALFCGELLSLLNQYFSKALQMSICDQLGRSGHEMVGWLGQPVGQKAMLVPGSGWTGREIAAWQAELWAK